MASAIAGTESFKASKTLLGIETIHQRLNSQRHGQCFKASKTLLGIETVKKVVSR